MRGGGVSNYLMLMLNSNFFWANIGRFGGQQTGSESEMQSRTCRPLGGGSCRTLRRIS